MVKAQDQYGVAEQTLPQLHELFMRHPSLNALNKLLDARIRAENDHELRCKNAGCSANGGENAVFGRKSDPWLDTKNTSNNYRVIAARSAVLKQRIIIGNVRPARWESYPPAFGRVAKHQTQPQRCQQLLNRFINAQRTINSLVGRSLCLKALNHPPNRPRLAFLPTRLAPRQFGLGLRRKIKVLNENLAELRDLAQDALDDAVLMGGTQAQIKQTLLEIIEGWTASIPSKHHE